MCERTTGNEYNIIIYYKNRLKLTTMDGVVIREIIILIVITSV